MEFDPYLGWIDVPDPNNPPPGARLIGASDLLRYEEGLRDAAEELAGLAARFAARSHTHSMSQVTGLTDAIDTAANSARNQAQSFATGAVSTHNSKTQSVHGISNTANLVYTDDSRLTDARTPTTHRHSWSQIDNKPSSYPPETHSHAIAQVTGLADRLTAIEGGIADLEGAETMVVKRHGSTADAPRPDAAVVYWIGASEPTNGAADDLWLNTTDRTLTVLDG